MTLSFSCLVTFCVNKAQCTRQHFFCQRTKHKNVRFDEPKLLLVLSHLKEPPSSIAPSFLLCEDTTSIHGANLGGVCGEGVQSVARVSHNTKIKNGTNVHRRTHTLFFLKQSRIGSSPDPGDSRFLRIAWNLDPDYPCTNILKWWLYLYSIPSDGLRG